MKHITHIGFILATLLLLSGCGERKEVYVAADNIWHAAEYMREGGPDQARAIEGIQLEAKAIMEASK